MGANQLVCQLGALFGVRVGSTGVRGSGFGYKLKAEQKNTHAKTLRSKDGKVIRLSEVLWGPLICLFRFAKNLGLWEQILREAKETGT